MFKLWCMDRSLPEEDLDQATEDLPHVAAHQENTVVDGTDDAIEAAQLLEAEMAAAGPRTRDKAQGVPSKTRLDEIDLNGAYRDRCLCYLRSQGIDELIQDTSTGMQVGALVDHLGVLQASGTEGGLRGSSVHGHRSESDGEFDLRRIFLEFAECVFGGTS